MKQPTTWKEQRAICSSTVAYIGNTGKRAFDAVVIEIRDPALPWEQTPRTVTIRTSSETHREWDTARVQKLCARLRKIGVKFTTSLGDTRNTGIRGTLFAYLVRAA